MSAYTCAQNNKHFAAIEDECLGQDCTFSRSIAVWLSRSHLQNGERAAPSACTCRKGCANSPTHWLHRCWAAAPEAAAQARLPCGMPADHRYVLLRCSVHLRWHFDCLRLQAELHDMHSRTLGLEYVLNRSVPACSGTPGTLKPVAKMRMMSADSLFTMRWVFLSNSTGTCRANTRRGCACRWRI